MRKQVLWLALIALAVRPAFAEEPPYRIAPGLFDLSRAADLGLKAAPGARTFTIFRARDNTDHYTNGVVLMPFKGRLYAQWQSSARDEDAPDTHVVYATSPDGEHWSAPKPLVPRDATMRTSGGWWTDGRMLVAYINAWGGDIRLGGHAEYVTTADGRGWSRPHRVMGADGKPVDGVIEQDTHALMDGRIVTAFIYDPGSLSRRSIPTIRRAFPAGRKVL